VTGWSLRVGDRSWLAHDPRSCVAQTSRASGLLAAGITAWSSGRLMGLGMSERSAHPVKGACNGPRSDRWASTRDGSTALRGCGGSGDAGVVTGEGSGIQVELGSHWAEWGLFVGVAAPARKASPPPSPPARWEVGLAAGDTSGEESPRRSPAHDPFGARLAMCMRGSCRVAPRGGSRAGGRQQPEQPPPRPPPSRPNGGAAAPGPPSRVRLVRPRRHLWAAGRAGADPSGRIWDRRLG